MAAKRKRKPKPKPDSGIASSPEELAERIRAQQSITPPESPPSKNMNYGGPGNSRAGAPRITGPDGGPIRFGLPGGLGKSRGRY